MPSRQSGPRENDMDGDGMGVAGLVAVFSTVGGGIGALITVMVTQYLRVRKARTDEGAEQKKRDWEELREHIQLIQTSYGELKSDCAKEKDEAAEKMDRLADRAGRAELRVARAESRIEFLEDKLRELGHAVRPFAPDAGAGPHPDPPDEGKRP